MLGPEAPLIALGGGLGALAVRLRRAGRAGTGRGVVGAAGSFAAISTLLGSPLLGAFLLMEASGLGGAMLGWCCVPGLLAAGIGALVFVGLDSLTGLGTFSLAHPGRCRRSRGPTSPSSGGRWSSAWRPPLLGPAIRRLALIVRPHVASSAGGAADPAGRAGRRRRWPSGTPRRTGKPTSDVLFSGQDALGPLIDHSADYSVGALLLLVACKGLAYALSLSGFRGGPVFPAMFLGAAGGIALSHLPGLPLVAGVAMGIGAMCVVMLRLPLTSVLLATLLLGTDGLAVMPVVIVAVVVAHVVTARLTPPPDPHATE